MYPLPIIIIHISFYRSSGLRKRIIYVRPNLLLDDTLDGASFENGTFAWNPWYDQAGTYDITFLPGDQQEPQYSQTMTIVVEDVQLSDWYQTWLEHLGLL